MGLRFCRISSEQTHSPSADSMDPLSPLYSWPSGCMAIQIHLGPHGGSITALHHFIAFKSNMGLRFCWISCEQTHSLSADSMDPLSPLYSCPSYCMAIQIHLGSPGGSNTPLHQFIAFKSNMGFRFCWISCEQTHSPSADSMDPLSPLYSSPSCCMAIQIHLVIMEVVLHPSTILKHLIPTWDLLNQLWTNTQPQVLIAWIP